MQLNKLREKYLSVIDSITNEFIRILKSRDDDYSGIARHFHTFIHERIDSMQILISYNCLWDADIILRPIAEACVKLAFISCFNDKDGNNEKVKEFWTDLSEINRLKESKQVAQIVADLNIKSESLNDLIIPEEEEIKLREKWTKSNRQKAEQPWSYNEMIKTISKESNHKEILCLNRNFTMSSHLIHADETALGVIQDRKTRNNDDKTLSVNAHIRRLFSDSVTLYLWILKLTVDFYKEELSEQLLFNKDEYFNEAEKY